MKNTLYILPLIIALFAPLAGSELLAQSTNVIVTVAPPPTPQTVHRIVIPAALATQFKAGILPQIDPQAASVTTQSVKRISLQANEDGSWSGMIIFQ